MELQLCANLNFLFPDLPLLERFEAAAKAGFKGVELLSPYEVPVKAIRERLDGTGLKQVLFNSPAGDRAAGERGMACIPGRDVEFRESVHRALDYAAALDCKLIHLMAGVQPEGVPYDTAAGLYAINLAWAAEEAQAAGVRLTIEAINHRDVAGYFLRTQEQATALIAAIGLERVGLQFDLYHCQTGQGDVTRRLEALMPLIAHMQVADVPGRKRARHGRDRLGVPIRTYPGARIRRMDRLRIPAERRHRGRPFLASALRSSGLEDESCDGNRSKASWRATFRRGSCQVVYGRRGNGEVFQ